jgi:pimeloyl-ACP methyl ester carboxylesterase
MQSSVISLRDLSISYISSQEVRRSDDSIPVVLIHGNSLSSMCFQQQFDGEIGKSFQLFAPDLPGHGYSQRATHPEEQYALRSFASAVVDFADQLGINDAVFIGWSLGGHIILEAADELPHARGFIIYGTPPLGNAETTEVPFKSHPASSLLFKPDFTEQEQKLYLEALFRPAVPEVPDTFRQAFLEADGRFREVLGNQAAQVLYKDEVSIVKNLTTPLAVFHGSEDQLINLDYLRALDYLSLWRDEIINIPNAGHSPQWEQPDHFNRLVREFIADTAG